MHRTTTRETWLKQTTCDVILVDDEVQPQHIAFFHGQQLLDVWDKPEASLIGRIYWARVTQVFPQHKLANIALPDGGAASLRMSSSKSMQVGQMVPVTITAEAYADKPAKAVYGAEIAGALTVLKLDGSGGIRASFKQSGTGAKQQNAENSDYAESLKAILPDTMDLVLRRRSAEQSLDAILSEVRQLIGLALEASEALETIPAEPSCIFSGVPVLHQAQIQSPHAKMLFGTSDVLWDRAIEQAELACSESVTTPSGIRLWFSQSRAVLAVDVDSAGSKFAPEDLMIEACAVLMQQLRLRQYAGVILLDLPRMSRAGRAAAYAWLSELAEHDPRHPDILGFGPAGLMELRIRHARTPLRDVSGLSAL